MFISIEQKKNIGDIGWDLIVEIVDGLEQKTCFAEPHLRSLTVSLLFIALSKIGDEALC